MCLDMIYKSVDKSVGEFVFSAAALRYRVHLAQSVLPRLSINIHMTLALATRVVAVVAITSAASPSMSLRHTILAHSYADSIGRHAHLRHDCATVMTMIALNARMMAMIFFIAPPPHCLMFSRHPSLAMAKLPFVVTSGVLYCPEGQYGDIQ
jgi:hypothetical protein